MMMSKNSRVGGGRRMGEGGGFENLLAVSTSVFPSHVCAIFH